MAPEGKPVWVRLEMSACSLRSPESWGHEEPEEEGETESVKSQCSRPFPSRIASRPALSSQAGAFALVSRAIYKAETEAPLPTVPFLEGLITKSFQTGSKEHCQVATSAGSTQQDQKGTCSPLVHSTDTQRAGRHARRRGLEGHRRARSSQIAECVGYERESTRCGGCRPDGG